MLSKLVSSLRMYSFVEMLPDKCQKELLIKDPVTHIYMYIYTKSLLNNTPFSAFTNMLNACNLHLLDTYVVCITYMVDL